MTPKVNLRCRVIGLATLQAISALSGCRFSDEQTTVLTELQKTATDNALEQALHEYHLDDVISKRDLKELDAILKHEMCELGHKIELLRADTQRQIAESMADLTRWIIGAGFCKHCLLLAYC